MSVITNLWMELFEALLFALAAAGTISSVWSSLRDQRQELSSELRNAAQGTVASTRYVRAITETRGDMRARTELNTPHPQQSPRTKQSLYSSLCSLPFRRPDTGPVMDA